MTIGRPENPSMILQASGMRTVDDTDPFALRPECGHLSSAAFLCRRGQMLPAPKDDRFQGRSKAEGQDTDNQRDAVPTDKIIQENIGGADYRQKDCYIA